MGLGQARGVVRTGEQGWCAWVGLPATALGKVNHGDGTKVEDDGWRTSGWGWLCITVLQHALLLLLGPSIHHHLLFLLLLLLLLVALESP
jgi:hypothetical protein